MPKLERINPLTGLKEYRTRYYYIDEDGKRKDTNTGWFPTKNQADEDARLKTLTKGRNIKEESKAKYKKTLKEVFEEFIGELVEKNNAENGITNSYKIYMKEARTIINKHTSEAIRKTKITDVNSVLFRKWLTEINNNPNLGGKTIRLKRHILTRFNTFLSENGYYYGREEMEDLVEVALNKVKIKSIVAHNKINEKKRNVVEPIDFEKLTNYYMQTIYDFKSFYYYTFFHVLFFSGMREEEIIALQWKHIDFKRGMITIENSIAEVEERESALKRIEEGKLRTKNVGSTRKIIMFSYYYELLMDYKECYVYEFNLSKEKVNDAFVFPRIPTHDPFDYNCGKNHMRELNRVAERIGLAKTDIQMFRHSASIFLMLPEPYGLGYSAEEIRAHFGHTDTKMITTIYGKFDEVQQNIKNYETFKRVRAVDQIEDEDVLEKLKEFLERVKGNNDKAKEARAQRIKEQITRAYLRGQTVWKYSSKDKEIIEEYKEDHCRLRSKITFVEVNVI